MRWRPQEKDSGEETGEEREVLIQRRTKGREGGYCPQCEGTGLNPITSRLCLQLKSGHTVPNPGEPCATLYQQCRRGFGHGEFEIKSWLILPQGSRRRRIEFLSPPSLADRVPFSVGSEATKRIHRWVSSWLPVGSIAQITVTPQLYTPNPCTPMHFHQEEESSIRVPYLKQQVGVGWGTY